jgi:serine/threonine protein kinase
MSDSLTQVAFKAPPPAELAPFFPGYEIEHLIATGGMGAVYRAVQKSLDRTVAIKILPQELSNDAAFCAGFEAEAKAMARLNHPNLIGVYDFGEVNGMLFIVMEYVPGQSLFHAANGSALDSGEVIRLITGICEGLAHAHEHGILHRDIKPANILLDLNAQPKIGDFGLARPVETKVQEGEEIFGTPHYTAPEVVNAPHTVDQRADIFSLGVMLHELLTGRLPDDDRRSASAIVQCDPRFDAIIRRATSPQPENRYHSASEIVKDLHVIEVSAGPRVLRTSAHATPALSAVTRHRLPAKKSSSASTILMLVLGIAFAAAAFIHFSKKPAEAPPVVDQPPVVSPPEPEHPPSRLPPAQPRAISTSRSRSANSPSSPAPPAPGKSSLAFHTLYAEGQRRYVETFSRPTSGSSSTAWTNPKSIPSRASRRPSPSSRKTTSAPPARPSARSPKSTIT